MTNFTKSLLARAILEAANRREASWDKAAYEADLMETKRLFDGYSAPDSNAYYRLTISQASREAVDKYGLPGLEDLITTLLTDSWNNALDWATRIVEGV